MRGQFPPLNKVCACGGHGLVHFAFLHCMLHRWNRLGQVRQHFKRCVTEHGYCFPFVRTWVITLYPQQLNINEISQLLILASPENQEIYTCIYIYINIIYLYIYIYIHPTWLSEFCNRQHHLSMFPKGHWQTTLKTTNEPSTMHIIINQNTLNIIYTAINTRFQFKQNCDSNIEYKRTTTHTQIK